MAGPPQNIQIVADGTGTIVQPRRGLKLPLDWKVVDHPNDSLNPGPNGEQLTGYIELVPPTGGAGGGLSGSTLAVGGYSLQPQPQQTTTGPTSVNLLPNYTSPTLGQSEDGKVLYRAAILGQTIAATYRQVYLSTVAHLAGGLDLTWSTEDAAQGNIANPFTGVVGTNPLVVTGAADNGSGLLRLTIAAGTSQLLTGQSAVSISVPGITIDYGVWIADVIDSTHVDMRGSSGHWSGTFTSNGTAAICGAIAAGTGAGTGTGLAGALWMQSETVGKYALRVTASGLYMCSTGGTTSNTGTGPTGTGTGIVDGTARWEWLNAGAYATVIWQAYAETWTLQG